MLTLKTFICILLFGTPGNWTITDAVSRWHPAAAWRSARAYASCAACRPVKTMWLSKTLFFNSVIVAMLYAEANISKLQGILPGNKYEIVAFVLPLVNLMLRFYTKQGVVAKTPGADEVDQ